MNQLTMAESEWTEEKGAAVASIEFARRDVAGGDEHTDTVVSCGFWKKNHAFELSFKRLGLLELADPGDDRPIVPVFLLPPGSRVETK